MVILQTGCEKYWGTDTKSYLSMQSGLDAEGLDYLLDQGIRCIGIDAWTLDLPAQRMAQKFKETGDHKHLWRVHMHGRKREYLHIEKMCNLDALPAPFGFYLSALPVKLEGATAGWCRAVALIPENGIER
jgi:cyclase